MKLFFLFHLILLAQSCNIDNPVYSVVISKDADYVKSSFINESNPLIVGYFNSAHLFSLITEEDKCFILFDSVLKQDSPKILRYSVRADPSAATPDCYLIIFQGSSTTARDIHNNNLLINGIVPEYVLEAKWALEDLIGSEQVPIIFGGYSLGGFLAESVGFIFDQPSFSVESPGSAKLTEKLNNIVDDSRDYKEYFLSKSTHIVGIPNFVSYGLDRIEDYPTILFSEPLTYCVHFISAFGKRFDFMTILQTPGWTDNYHNYNNLLHAIIENKDNPERIFETKLLYRLKPIIEDPRVDNQLKAIYDCVKKYTWESGSYEEIKERMIGEIVDKRIESSQ